MSNFLVNDTIRCYYEKDNNNIIFIETYGNGLITKIEDNNVYISSNSNYIQIYSLSNLNNFKLDDYIKICKKIANDDWIDKDGEHYLDNGYNKANIYPKLREERNKKLFNTDCRIVADFPHPSEEVKQAWITYRQELRDLPANADPSLDENGELINITWPTPPS